MCYYTKIMKIKWVDSLRNEDVLRGIKETRSIIRVSQIQDMWPEMIGYILRDGGLIALVIHSIMEGILR